MMAPARFTSKFHGYDRFEQLKIPSRLSGDRPRFRILSGFDLYWCPAILEIVLLRNACRNYLVVSILTVASAVVWMLSLPGTPEFGVKVSQKNPVVYGNIRIQSKFQPQVPVLARPELRARQYAASGSIIDQTGNSTIGPVQQASVWGTIWTESGAVTNRDKVIFHSLSLDRHYVTYSNANGYFYISEMTPANDYRMRVVPTGMFRLFVRENLDLTLEQTRFSVVLRDLPQGSLNGILVNPEGVPVPGYGLKIRSLEKDLWVATAISDINGEFRVESVPLGGLEFSSTFGPAMRITGHEISGELQLPITLVVDQGANEINGIIFDQLASPVGGAVVGLDWVSVDDEIHSVVSRQGVTDASGKFSIKGLGSGVHDLMIVVADGSTHRQTIEVSANNIDLEISLAATGQKR